MKFARFVFGLSAILALCLSPAYGSGKNAEPSTAKGAYDRAWKLLCDGKQADAEEYIEDAIDKFPQDQKLAFLHASCKRSRASIAESNYLFEKLQRLQHKSPETLCAKLVVALNRREDTEANLDAFRELIKKNPDNMPILWMFAVQCRWCELDKEGVEAYERLLKNMDKGPVLVHHTCANLLDNLARCEDSLKHRKIAVEMEPSGWTYDGLGNTLSLMKRFEEASAAYKKSTELDPTRGCTWHNWGFVLLAAEKVDEAIEKYNHSVRLDPMHDVAWLGLGECYEAKGQKKDEFRCYEQASALGSARASYLLGWMCEHGQGVAKNSAQAFKYYVQGAARKDPTALWALAECHMNGYGTPHDPGAAVSCYEKAVALGSSLALTSLGTCYLKGEGVQKDKTRAIAFYEKAVSNGYTKAYAKLGEILKCGDGVPKDPVEAEKWLRKGVALGDDEAMYEMGHLYDYYVRREGQFDEAMKWYRMAAEKKHSTAMHNIGNMYYEGRGRKADKTEAFNWFKKSADVGHSKAITYVGYAYLHGEGTARDKDKGLSYLHRGQDREEMMACYHEAFAYLKGWDIERDLKKARDACLRGTELGNWWCMNNLSRIYSGFVDDPDTNLCNFAEAVRIANDLVEAAPGNWEHHETLAAAFAASGQFDKAVAEQTEAIEKLNLTKNPEKALQRANANLKLYRDRKSFTASRVKTDGTVLE